MSSLQESAVLPPWARTPTPDRLIRLSTPPRARTPTPERPTPVAPESAVVPSQADPNLTESSTRLDRPASPEVAAEAEQAGRVSPTASPKGTAADEESVGQEPPAASPVGTAVDELADEPADEPAEAEQAGHVPDAASEDAAGEEESAGREPIGTHEPVGSMAQPIDVQPLRIDASQVCFYYLLFIFLICL